MKIISTEVVSKGKFSSYNVTKFEDKNGGVRGWEWFEKKDVIAILPVTDEGKFVCIKSFRIPVQNYVIESPAGLLENVSNLDQIRQELLEETGYQCGELVVMGIFPLNAGITKNTVTYCIGLSAKKIDVQKLEASEDITVMELTRDELLELVREGKKLVDPGLLSLICLFDSMRHEKKSASLHS